MTAIITDMESHLETVAPGQPFSFTEAASVGDGCWQGDLGLEVVAGVPAGYELASKPSTQLVPGATQGSRHCLDSLKGVKLYLPEGWPTPTDQLAGPVFVLSKPRTVTHPVHGDVSIPAGFTIRCRYQREYDAEQRRERRAAD